jgi:hypothetical protein
MHQLERVSARKLRPGVAENPRHGQIRVFQNGAAAIQQNNRLLAVFLQRPKPFLAGAPGVCPSPARCCGWPGLVCFHASA